MTDQPHEPTTDTGAIHRHAAPRPGTPWRAAPGLAVRGGLVGMAESVPGISGGTVALITGLYDRLLGAANQVVHAGRELVQGVVQRRGLRPAARALRAVDWRFLVPVIAGMAVVLLVSLNTIAPLLEEHPVPVRSVFFGMIAVSVLVPLRMMPRRFRPADAALLVAAAVIGFFLVGLPPAEATDPSLWYVAGAAAIAINALVLPGVSGSTLLVVMGLYVPVQQAIEDRDLAFVGAFALGAIVGLASFVKLLHWLLEHRRQGTMAVLAGLMIGSLRALWPWQDADGGLLAPPDAGSVLGPVLLALAGAAVVGAAIWWESSRTADA
ncbi:undecaprenyl phosphate translocase family protein [Isoptericola chiayiensis]|uniref:undecaprenyl phosphate translocase family protein n=1 Tax=Isoptericola chiayiensis TaxID=579446 RepID=UPI001556F7E0|nr:putative membrane protein [Isoptericola chiayiensis]